MRVGFYAFTAPLNFPRTYPFPWPNHMQREGCARYARGGATNHAETQLPPSSNDACRNCSFQSPLCVTCPIKLSTIVVVRYAAFARIGFPFWQNGCHFECQHRRQDPWNELYSSESVFGERNGSFTEGAVLYLTLFFLSLTLPIFIHANQHNNTLLSIIISHHSKPPHPFIIQTPPLHNHQSSQQTRL